jgi:hypothetical protein
MHYTQFSTEHCFVCAGHNQKNLVVPIAFHASTQFLNFFQSRTTPKFNAQGISRQTFPQDTVDIMIEVSEVL